MAVSYVCKHMNFANIRFICFEKKKSQPYENGHFICLQTCEIINVPMYDSYVWYKNSCFIICKPGNRPTCDSLALEMKNCKHMKFYQHISQTRDLSTSLNTVFFSRAHW